MPLSSGVGVVVIWLSRSVTAHSLLVVVVLLLCVFSAPSWSYLQSPQSRYCRRTKSLLHAAVDVGPLVTETDVRSNFREVVINELDPELSTFCEMTNEFTHASNSGPWKVRLLELKDCRRATDLVVEVATL